MDRPLADPPLLEPGDDPLLGPGPVEIVQELRIDRPPIPEEGLAVPVRAWIDRANDVEAIPDGKIPVPLILPRDRHDRPGAVAHQHIVGDVDRYLLPVDRVDGEAAREHPGLLALGETLDLRLAGRPSYVLPRLGLGVGARDQLLDEWVLGSENTEGHPEDRVGPGGEHIERGIDAIDWNPEPSAFGPADPVPLHGPDPVRPVVEMIEVVEQPIGVVGDLEEPLGQVSLLDQRPASLTGAIHYLLVGEHGLILGAPVDRRGRLVGETTVEELEE